LAIARSSAMNLAGLALLSTIWTAVCSLAVARTTRGPAMRKGTPILSGRRSRHMRQDFSLNRWLLIMGFSQCHLDGSLNRMEVGETWGTMNFAWTLLKASTWL